MAAERELVAALFARAKQASTVLSEQEMLVVCAEHGVAPRPR